MASGGGADKGGEDNKGGQKDKQIRIWAAVGGIMLAANTQFVHPYTVASNVIFGLAAIALLRALLFDLPLQLARLKSAASRLERRLSGARRGPGQHSGVQLAVSLSRQTEQVIGVIAMLLPFVLIYGAPVSSAGSYVLASLSEYYYSPMRNILVGVLCVLGTLLILQVGDNVVDGWLTSLAGASCIGVALFPVHPAGRASGNAQVVGICHDLFILIMFIALGIITIRFAASERGDRLARVTHLACGYGIFAFLVLAEASAFLPANNVPVLLSGETAALTVAGVSWFVRGRRSAARVSAAQGGASEGTGGQAGESLVTEPSA